MRVCPSTAVRDEDIIADIIDYGIPARPAVAYKVSYADLSGSVVSGETVRHHLYPVTGTGGAP